MGNSPSGRDADTSDHGAVHSPPSQFGSTSQHQQERGMRDARGVDRGRCKNCPQCVEYVPPAQQCGLRCIHCNCPPGAHENLAAKQAWGGGTTTDGWANQPAPLASTTVPDFSIPQVPTASAGIGPFNQGSLCSYPGCSQEVEFDLNTGIESSHCSVHLHAALPDTSAAYCGPLTDTGAYNPSDHLYVQDVEMPQQFAAVMTDSSPAAQFQPPPPPLTLPPILPSGAKKCAIPECPNPCYVDPSGTVHECCGYTHAMEHQRRQALLQQTNQQIVKGLTHCLLPGCSNPTWPFENYCGRTHANIGKQQGLIPPLPSVDTSAPQQPKDSSLCIFPNCNRPKFVEGATTHPYCSRRHAEQGRQLGIVPSAEKVEDQCEFPGCTKPKRKEGTRVHDYCCRDHADRDAPNRDARILTSYSEVQNFLNKFSNLKVVSIDENPHAKAPGGQLFQRFKSKMLSLPKHQRNTCLAFHGTAEGNIQSICKNGYDPSLRSGQAYGAGEYFATSPNTPLSYCKGGKKMLLNELLLGQQGVHHTQHGDIVVMKDPAHDLPRYVITFQ